ncbi:hypothetical protein BKA62DRAFT_705868 [Auriculariales sp. MPI-PUGE-AT-0066]|nr:hypothetical protein BKA62DRAFT_705868 [Auriculariales sp. MPI-PUGE-AT-0066]
MSDTNVSDRPQPTRTVRTYGRAAPVEPAEGLAAPVLLRRVAKPRARSPPSDGSGSDNSGSAAPVDIGYNAHAQWRSVLKDMDNSDNDSPNPTGTSQHASAEQSSTKKGVLTTPPSDTSAAVTVPDEPPFASSPAGDSAREQNLFDSSMNMSLDSNRSGNHTADTTPPTSPGAWPVHPAGLQTDLGKPSMLREPTPDEDRPFATRAAQQTKKVARPRTSMSGATKASRDPTIQKPKKFTKRDLDATNRETARILSDVRVQLPRGEQDRKLFLSDLTAKMTDKLSQKSKATSSVLRQPSSPIERFSSSSAIDDHEPPPVEPSTHHNGQRSKPIIFNDTALQAAAAPVFGKDRKRVVVQNKDLSATLLKRAQQAAVDAREKKKNDWLSRGGTLKPAESERVRPAEAQPTDAEDQDARDCDWQPDDHNSDADDESEREVSPGIGSGDDEDDGPAATLETPGTQDLDMLGSDTEEEDGPFKVPTKVSRRLPMQKHVVQSDDESEGEQPTAHSRVLVPGISFIDPIVDALVLEFQRSPSPSQSEMGKENSEFRKYSQHDSKENDAPTRLSLLDAPARDEDDDKENTRGALLSSSADEAQLQGSDDSSDGENLHSTTAYEDKENVPTRRPLSTLPRRHSSFVGGNSRAALAPVRGAERSALPLGGVSFESLDEGDDASGLDTNPSRLSFGDDDADGPSGLGFTQLFDDDEPVPVRPFLGRSKTDFLPGRRLFAEAIDSQASITFTPQSQQMRARGQAISESQRRKDDELLAADNEEVLTQAAPINEKNEPEWYIGDSGLMTQTRPSYTPIQVPRTQPASAIRLAASPFGREMSPTPGGLLDSPIVADQPLRRLKRKCEADAEILVPDLPDTDGFFSPSHPRPTKKQRSAFDVLRDGSSSTLHSKLPKERKPFTTDFVEDQANESDEEKDFGFGAAADEEYDEEEMRAAVAGMTDDKKMDVDELAEDLVVEKHKEHLREEDDKLQALHEKATRGDLRKKKNRDGLSFDDDSSDEEGRVKRPRPQKRARDVQNDTLPDLAKHNETRPFFNLYQKTTVDDDVLELQDASFGASSDNEDVLMAEDGQNEEMPVSIEDGVDENDQEDSDWHARSRHPITRRRVGQRQIQEELREAARKKDSFGLNPDDATWIDQNEDDDTDLEVEELQVVATKRTVNNDLDRDVVSRKSHIAPTNATKLADWAKNENRKFKGSTARTGGKGSAVTGHPSRTSSSVGAPSLSSADQRSRKTVGGPAKKTAGLNGFLQASRSRV